VRRASSSPQADKLIAHLRQASRYETLSKSEAPKLALVSPMHVELAAGAEQEQPGSARKRRAPPAKPPPAKPAAKAAKVPAKTPGKAKADRPPPETYFDPKTGRTIVRRGPRAPYRPRAVKAEKVEKAQAARGRERGGAVPAAAPSVAATQIPPGCVLPLALPSPIWEEC